MTDNKKPTREEAEAAVRTMLAWTGDNPDREGLVETPKRVVRVMSNSLQGMKWIQKKFFQKCSKKLKVTMKW